MVLGDNDFIMQEHTVQNVTKEEELLIARSKYK